MRLRLLPVFLICTCMGFGHSAQASTQETGVTVTEANDGMEEEDQAPTYPAGDASESAIGLDAVQAQDASESARSGNRPGVKQNKFVLPAANLDRDFVPIARQAENHLLITVGDTVYLPTPGFITLKATDSFYIYKHVKKMDIAQGKVGWLTQVGKLKIVASLNELTIGRVITARDIIRKGDFVLLRHEP